MLYTFSFAVSRLLPCSDLRHCVILHGESCRPALTYRRQRTTAEVPCLRQKVGAPESSMLITGRQKSHLHARKNIAKKEIKGKVALQ